ncbi:A disintegrin and metalloproteinase with thrombospondin motifs 15-like [Bombus terrestris]|uniref:A disintegrin and metalloproteinase with thrombospondin motifs 15-like n=1 Tax=Bombus terrestris TaxID=30195 RepID=A0A9C6WC35_BOMTE|nr:A disintegrin and metalloproteinase with thrombospondin motifs 15-like [Bombus terrestris]
MLSCVLYKRENKRCDNQSEWISLIINPNLYKITNPEEIGYFSGPKWQRNRLSKKRPAAKDSPPRWLELGIAADYSVVDFHGIRVQQYILALLNIVSAIYMDPSLESNMILVIVRMILYAEKRDGMIDKMQRVPFC